MANPIKAVKAAKRLVVGSNKDIKTNKNINKKLEKTLGVKTISQGKAKAVKKREIAKSKMSPQMTASKAKLAKATSNRKVARAGVSGNTAAKGMSKGFIKDIKKQGKAYDQNLSNTRKNFPYYASDIPKVPVKRRGK